MYPNKHGCLWWLRDEDGVFAFSALDSGGKVIYRIPEKHLVLAVASKVAGKLYAPWTLFEDFILPVN
ncbi:MAG: hypothetical protein GX799_04085 [Crenarchaeota archaeon]|nr:hypothetical protein [Thermoproteota archaeon]